MPSQLPASPNSWLSTSWLRIASACLLAICFSPATLVGDDNAKEGPDRDSSRSQALALFGPLLGECWEGQFPGTESIDEHCFEAVYGGVFVRDTHIVRTPGKSPYEGETLYFWDPATEQVRFSYFASNAGVSEGSVAASETGLVFGEEHHRGSDGTERVFRGRFDWAGDSGDKAYDSVTEEKLADGWKSVSEVRFEKVREKGPKSDDADDAEALNPEEMQFAVYWMVFLERPTDPPSLGEEALAKLQQQHLAHLTKVREGGYSLVAGPFEVPAEEPLRGIVFYRGDLSEDEVRSRAEADPMVVAGRLKVTLRKWWTVKGLIEFPR